MRGEITMDTNLLKSKMVLKGDTQNDLANALDVSRATLSFKMNQRTNFKQSEIDIITKRYELSSDEIRQIFFNN